MAFGKYFLLFSLVIAAVTAKFLISEPSHQKYLWEEYKQSFNKRYNSLEEESKRFDSFIANLKVIDERNALEIAAGGSAVHGVTKFSDLSQDEFRDVYLRSTPSVNKGKIAKVSHNVTSDSFVDWSGILTTPVKDQGYCGSCWAFSATEQIESDAIRTLGVNYLLSPEQIVQCDSLDSGCRGGATELAYTYVKTAGGLETEAAYPYSSYYGKTGQCTSNRLLNVVSVNEFYSLETESDMAAYVQSTGPLSVCLDAENWNSYTAGIMYVCGKTVDHCVQAVGVYPASDGGYWKVRNSWGYSWGEAGYIRLSYGSNTCAIARDPTYTSVSLVE